MATSDSLTNVLQGLKLNTDIRRMPAKFEKGKICVTDKVLDIHNIEANMRSMVQIMNEFTT